MDFVMLLLLVPIVIVLLFILILLFPVVLMTSLIHLRDTWRRFKREFNL